jgi:hypothetical protein
MLSLIGMPMVVAAWAVPALFLGALAGLIGFALGRPLFMAWGRGFDLAVGHVARVALWTAEGLAQRSYDHAVRHVGRDH